MQNSKIPAIAGGVMSLNRVIDPMRMFVRADGAYLYDDQGAKYIDYHAAFGPYLLGHGDEDVDNAVKEMLNSGASLIGAGTTPWESEIAELIVDCVPGLEQIQLTNSGTEAVMYANPAPATPYDQSRQVYLTPSIALYTSSNSMTYRLWNRPWPIMTLPH